MSEEVKAILSLCWKGDQPMATNFIIGETYIHKDKKLTMTEDTYNELIEVQKEMPIKIFRNNKLVNVVGLRKSN
jgi:hypothetical protein